MLSGRPAYRRASLRRTHDDDFTWTHEPDPAPAPPPYYAVIAPAELGQEVGGYAQFGPSVVESAAEVDGFLGIETGFQPGFSLAVSYWQDLEAIDQWRNHPTHQIAKQRGRDEWFTGYATRIAQVLYQY